ncbi:Pheromone receptor [Mycena venus]|uniref:Pheromone receptor n=1 Tax=Mycena venus TaxID=2733690 RepID=A0A8H7CNW8_9AGAR|nr:Pheromone receptor [Mycena venus]
MVTEEVKSKTAIKVAVPPVSRHTLFAEIALDARPLCHRSSMKLSKLRFSPENPRPQTLPVLPDGADTDLHVDAIYPLCSFFAFLAFVLIPIPLPWCLQAWNLMTGFYMVWAALACLDDFISSGIWADNAINTAPEC